jgi:cell division septum initiation protein DivIVA
LGIDQKSAEREGLETEAYLSRAPVEVRKLVDSLEARLAKSEQEAVRLNQGLIESERKAVRLSQTLAKLRQAMISAGIQVPEVDLDI